MTGTPTCRSCRHFDDAPPAIEAALPGLTSLGSAYAAVRCDDGLCAVHGRLVGAARGCAAHASRGRHSGSTSTRQS
jgi:hypothetical protein